MDFPGSRGAPAGTTGRVTGGAMVGFVGSSTGATGAAARVDVEIEPISIVLPAGSPPWSAVTLIRSAVSDVAADLGAF